MKLLLDENLSRRLVPFLLTAYPESTQVVLVGLEAADDAKVWDYAKTNDFVIVTQDADFEELSLVKGHPPRVIWIKTNHPSRSTILKLLTHKFDQTPGGRMSAYVIFDVEIFDLTRYQEFMAGVKPALEAAGGKYLARAGEHRVYEGDWEPRRIVILEFPDIAAFESFYNGPVYQGLKSIRDECSRARLVAVQGL